MNAVFNSIFNLTMAIIIVSVKSRCSNTSQNVIHTHSFAYYVLLILILTT